MKKFLKLLYIPLCTLLFFINFSNAQTDIPSRSDVNVFLSYEKVPERVYIGEIFPIVLKVIITSRYYDEITTKIANNNNFEMLNKKVIWTKTSNPQILNATIYLKAKKKTTKIPGFKIELLENDEVIETAAIGSVDIESVKLNADKNFSGVIAKNFVVASSFTNRFDENSIILTANFEAAVSNLEDFNISIIEKARVDTLTENNFEHQKIQYSAILPNYTRLFEFTYFDTTKNNFELIKIPLILKSDDISTHVDINPKENMFNLYKNIALGILAVILIVIFFIKRYKITLILAFMILAFIAYNNHPFNDIKIEQNTNVHILPNEKLTILYKTENIIDAEKLDEKNGFIKVLLPNEKIGWVKKESVIKN